MESQTPGADELISPVHSLDAQGKPQCTNGWRRVVESLRRSRLLWGPFATRGPEEILGWQNVAGGIESLRKVGVTCSWGLVLRYGPRRCRHVRRKVEGYGPSVRDPGALVTSLVRGGAGEAPSGKSGRSGTSTAAGRRRWKCSRAAGLTTAEQREWGVSKPAP